MDSGWFSGICVSQEFLFATAKKILVVFSFKKFYVHKIITVYNNKKGHLIIWLAT